MADFNSIPPGNYTMEFGPTFSENKKSAPPVQYHTLRYDFKPKSVASAETETYIAFGGNGDCHIAVPTDGDNLTVFKGSKKEAKPKECLLFFDKKTGKVRLEKISTNIYVKKTRDIDKSTETSLRTEMAKLKTSKPKESSVPQKKDDDEHMSSSSSSDSSGSDSDSGSDDDDEKGSKRDRKESNSSTDDMERALLATVNGEEPPPTTAPPPVEKVNRPPPHKSRDDLGLQLSDDSSSDDDN